ncbi:unnamed protein product [Paramecium primaurelia]|uniref:Uncharacterized protein n=1 Tax=Paramecium primaurelia TaxID=5886 RepID=A0A8S1PMU1_PARPR|nr:unnamed protein product [Paramecium primaurelia]
METDLCNVIELVLAIILLNMFYYIKGLQKYMIKEETFQPNEKSKLIITVAIAFYAFCYIFTINRDDQQQGCIIPLIVVLTFLFQYIMLQYCIFLFKTLNQGLFIARPRYNINIRKSFSIIIVSTLSLELFMSIIFQDKYFWLVFGVPMMIYLLLIRMFGYFWVINKIINLSQ